MTQMTQIYADVFFKDFEPFEAFEPYFHLIPNKTTSVADECSPEKQPHYLIFRFCLFNEVMRLLCCVQLFATEVVLFGK
jgi:hypothetical protein